MHLLSIDDECILWPWNLCFGAFDDDCFLGRDNRKIVLVIDDALNTETCLLPGMFSVFAHDP
jgi:hypothetical protein